MKRLLGIIIPIFILSSCYQESKTINIENVKKIKNEIITSPDFYDKNTEVTFHDQKDIAKFKSDLKELNKEIKTNTGSLSFDQIMTKTKLLDYLGNTGEALEIYEENFGNNGFSESLAYNHNLAKLYEKLGEEKKALLRYEFMIKFFSSHNYYKNIAEIFRKQGNEEKYNLYIDAYNEYKISIKNDKEGKSIKVNPN